MIRSTIFLFALVGALLVGLLAMHTVSSSLGNHSDPAMSAMDDSANPKSDMAAMSDVHVGPADCSGMCDPGHSMTVMVCVLALLFTGFLLAAIRPAALLNLAPAGYSFIRLVRAFAAREGPAPPDLKVLSIFRT